MEQVKEHLERSSTYWRQAQEHHKRGETEKTTELAWGSVTQAIMALALARGNRRLRTHREVKAYTKNAATQLGDKELAELFADGEAAHANFYQDFMDEQEVRDIIAKMGKLLEKIHRLMPA